jgi:hypothetical protein
MIHHGKQCIEDIEDMGFDLSRGDLSGAVCYCHRAPSRYMGRDFVGNFRRFFRRILTYRDKGNQAVISSRLA